MKDSQHRGSANFCHCLMIFYILIVKSDEHHCFCTYSRCKINKFFFSICQDALVKWVLEKFITETTVMLGSVGS